MGIRSNQLSFASCPPSVLVFTLPLWFAYFAEDSRVDLDADGQNQRDSSARFGYRKRKSLRLVIIVTSDEIDCRLVTAFWTGTWHLTPGTYSCLKATMGSTLAQAAVPKASKVPASLFQVGEEAGNRLARNCQLSSVLPPQSLWKTYCTTNGIERGFVGSQNPTHSVLR